MGGVLYKSAPDKMCSRTREEAQEDVLYKTLIGQIVNKAIGFPHSMSKILDHLYLGDQEDSSNLSMLRRENITHVINCAAGYAYKPAGFYGNINYLEFHAEDDSTYDIMQHFDDTYRFIESARKSGGKVLIHCLMGINRSAALSVAYVMLHKNLGPISAVRLVYKARGMILSNDAFQSQIVSFARQRQMLYLDRDLLAGNI